MEDKVYLLSIADLFNDLYSIPLYQRCFAWSTEQIATLLQDIYSSYNESKKENKGIPYYVGCLVVMKKETSFEVIDGQQRLTFFTLLTKILGVNTPECKIEYESRELEQEFLKRFYENENFYNENNTDAEIIKLKRRNADLIKAIYDICNVNLIAEGESAKILNLATLESTERTKFINYIKNKVFLLRTEVSKNTDVNSYFEIMNNRGKQLQEHEILKSLIMSGLGHKVSQQMKFGMIWDACSQMNRPIQKSFSSNDRNIFFGSDWNTFVSFDEFKKYFEENNETSNTIETKSFDELLNATSDPFVNETKEYDENYRGSFKYQSIIDFPNFLMHIFKLFYDPNDQIALDEKFLMRDYKEVLGKPDPEEFIYKLFLTRTLFDRFIIKIEGVVDDKYEDDNISIAKEDEEFFWRLLEPVKNSQNQLDYRVETEFSSDSFVKSLSMLQVTFRSRHHKKWLQELLKFLVASYKEHETINVNEIFKKEYLKTIHSYIRNYFKQNITNEHEKGMGTNTPHFLFNLIDYLYWIAKKNNLQKQFPEMVYVKDFNFRYHNSVEHHYPQHPDNMNTIEFKEVEPLVDNLGNLCLISKGTNSRLQNVSPWEKVQNRAGKAPDVNGVKAFPPKRQIMYTITQNTRTWGKSQIEEHYKNVLELLNSMEDLLGVDKTEDNQVSITYTSTNKEQYESMQSTDKQVQANPAKENNVYFHSVNPTNEEKTYPHKGESQMHAQVSQNNLSDVARFKKLLEYFVAHVEYCQKLYLHTKKDPNVDPSTCVGYDEYVAPYIRDGRPVPLEMNEWKPKSPNAILNKKIKGQWDTFGDKEIRMVVRNQRGSYSSASCFLDWGGWRNINNRWNNDRSKIIALKIRKNLNESAKNRDWRDFANTTLTNLGLFDGQEPNESLEEFFDTYLNL